MSIITQDKITELYGPCDDGKQDVVECSEGVSIFLKKLVFSRNITDTQLNQIGANSAKLDQATNDVKKARSDLHDDQYSTILQDRLKQAETNLRSMLFTTRVMLVHWITTPASTGPVAPPIGPPDNTIDKQIENLKKEAAKNPDDDSLVNSLGVAYLLKRDFAEAAKCFRDAIEIDGGVADYYANLADAYRQLNQYDDALRNYEIAISMNNQDDTAINGLANILFAEKKYEKAIENYLKAIQINPQPIYYDNIGDAYGKLGYCNQAIKYYKQALILAPDDTWTLNGLALTFIQIKDYKNAVQYFEKILKITPDDPIVHYGLGVAFTHLRQDDKAVENFNKALELNPKDYKSWGALGDVKLRMKEFSDAIESYEKATSLSALSSVDLNPADYLGLGDAYRGLGKSVEAVRNYEKAAKISEAIEDIPEKAASLNGIGLVRLNEGKFEDAVDYFDQAIKADPEVYVYHSNYANGLAQMGKLNDAIESYKKALQLNPNEPVVLESLGLCYNRLGLFADAIDQFKTALNIQEDPRYYLDIGNSYRCQRDWKNAFEYLQKAVASEPTNKTYLKYLATAYNEKGVEHWKKKEDFEAIKFYDLAIQLEPGNDVYHANKYLACNALNDDKQAERHLNIAMKLNPNRQEYKQFLAQFKTKQNGKSKNN